MTKTAEVPPTSGSLHRPLAVLLVGLGIVLGEVLLTGFQIAGIGASSDLGGGGILLIGLIFIGSGLVAVIGTLIRRRGRRYRG